ncbi:MAG TPA: adenine phosphoribosyltransferase [Mycobacteriales bacterium]|jgi:adenine phosphoribosyltransferase|nr:adenine phosphoribosyltransferase [Mycobacteriales bacterium]
MTPRSGSGTAGGTVLAEQLAQQLAPRVSKLLLDVPDFPVPGVLFKDLTPLFGDPGAFAETVEWFAAIGREAHADAVVGIESRGFLLGAPAALSLGVPFVPVRKAGKLPRAVFEESYDLEYGSAVLAVHADALSAGARVLVLDDVLATGGTAAAAAALVRRGGAQPVAVSVLLELGFLGGRARVGDLPVTALVTA